MNRFFLAAILTLGCYTLHAQHTFEGVVRDQQNQKTLPGAHVVVQGTFLGTFTDADGRFSFTNLQSQQYTFEISFLGYEKKTFEVNPSEENFREISLENASLMSQEVIVNATRADEKTPSTFTNVNKEEIAMRNLGQDLPVLLSLTPSLVTSSDAGAGVGYTWMNIRGSDNSRINVTLNGIPVNDAESHGVWWVNMPDIASSSDNIQIQRGVGVSTQGAAAFGATISVNTTDLNKEAYGEVHTSGGSFNTLRNTVNFGTGLMGDHWVFDGRLSRISSDGFIDRATSDLKSFYLSGGYYGKKTVVKAITFSGAEKTYQAWHGVPGDMLDTDRRFNPSGMYFDDEGSMKFYDNETDNYQQDHYQLHLTHEFNPSLIANTSLHYTYGRGYYEQYREDESFQDYGLEDVTIESALFTETDLIRRRWLDNHFYGITYSLKYNTSNKFDVTFGGGFNIYEGDHFGEIIWAALAQNMEKGHRFYDNDAQKSDLNNFVKLNYQVSDGLFLFTDLQYRNIVYDFTGLALVENQVSPLDQRAVFHFFNPKAGLLYKFGGAHEAYGFAGISNREPVRRDFTESSPDSRPTHETLYNVEAGYRYQSANTSVGVNIYVMDYDNQLILTGEINDVGGFSRTNIKDSYRMGIELEGSVNITEKLDWTGNLSFSRNKIPTFTEFSDVYDENWNWMGSQEETYENTDIAFSPSVVSGSHFRYTPVKNLYINLFSKYVGDQYIDNTMSNDRKLDAYLVNDLSFTYEIKNGFFNRLEFTFMINNIMDVEYITNAWIYKGYLGSDGLVSIADGYFPQAGRHYLAGMRLRL